jgi:hypothetical protein
VKEKVYAYILKDNRLLTFRHTQAPEAGLQVPGGTVEAGELLNQAPELAGDQGRRLGQLSSSTYLIKGTN